MLQPSRTKYRKQMTGNIRKGISKGGNYVAFGDYGIKSMGTAFVTSRQIESARRVLTRYTKKTGKIWIRIFPHKPITQKGIGMKMGKGKGAVDHYVAVVKPGRIMFEMGGIDADTCRTAMKLAGDKLPIKTKFVGRDL